MGAKHTQSSLQKQNNSKENIRIQIHHPYFTQPEIVYRNSNANLNNLSIRNNSIQKLNQKNDSPFNKQSSSIFASDSIQNSNTAYIKNIKVTDGKYYKEWKQNLLKYHFDNQFLLLPLYEKFNQQGLCSTQGSLQIEYQNFNHLLSDEIEERKITKKYFKQTQLWYLLYAYISTKSYLYDKSSKQQVTKHNISFGILGDIRPHNIFINQNQQVKFSTLLSWPNEKTNYQKSFSGIKTYLAPEDIQKLNLGVKQKADIKLNQSSEMFSIGLTLMSVAILKDFLYLYDLQKFKINYQELTNLSNQLRFHKEYSPLIKQVILNLCQLDYKNRFNCKQLYSWLSKYQRRLIEKKPFKFQQIPQRINEIMNKGNQNQFIKIISSEPSSLQTESRSFSFRGNSDFKSPASKVVFNYEPKVTQLKFQYKSPGKITSNKQSAQEYTSIIYAPITKNTKLTNQKQNSQKIDKITPISKISIEEHLINQSYKNIQQAKNISIGNIISSPKNIQKILYATLKLIEPVTNYIQDPQKKKIQKDTISFNIPQILDTLVVNQIKELNNNNNSGKMLINQNLKHDTKYYTIQNLIIKPTLKSFSKKSNNFVQEQLKAQMNEIKKISSKLQDQDIIKKFISLGTQQNITKKVLSEHSSKNIPTLETKILTKKPQKKNMNFMIFDSPHELNQNYNKLPQMLQGGKNQLSDYFDKLRQLKPTSKKANKKDNKNDRNLIIHESQRVHNEKTEKMMKTLNNNELHHVKDLSSNAYLNSNKNLTRLYNPIGLAKQNEDCNHSETDWQIPLQSTGPYKKTQSQTQNLVKKQKKGFMEIILPQSANRIVS